MTILAGRSPGSGAEPPASCASAGSAAVREGRPMRDAGAPTASRLDGDPASLPLPALSPDELLVLDLVATVVRAAGPAGPQTEPRVALYLVCAALRCLGYEPEAAWALVAQGLDEGRAVYGPLDLATDQRDLLGEAAAELRDACVYLAAAIVRGSR